MKNARFSLLTVFFAITTVAAVAGWWGATRKADLAWAEAVRMRQTLEAQQARIGVLNVIDETKFHAVAIESQQQYFWDWKLFLPVESEHVLCVADQPSKTADGVSVTHPLPMGSPCRLQAQIQPNASRNWEVVCRLDERVITRVPLDNFNYESGWRWLDVVAPGESAVWEPGETPLLLHAHGDEAGGGIAIWIAAKP